LAALMFADVTAARLHHLSNRNFFIGSTAIKSLDGLIDPADSGGIDTADTAFDFTLAGSYVLWAPDDRTNLRVGATFFSEDYTDFSLYDTQMLGATVALNRIVDGHLLGVRVGTSEVWIAGEDYVRNTDITISDRFAFNDSWALQVNGRYRDVVATDPSYAYLDGRTFDIGLTLDGLQRSPWRFDYTFRRESRRDDYYQIANEAGTVFDSFRSYSRDYHRVRSHYKWNWNDSWSQIISAGVRFANYENADLFLSDPVDSTLTDMLRDTFRYEYETELVWAFSDRLQFRGGVEFLSEDSNIDLYDFDSLQFDIGASYAF
jgi:hypothetical protein